MAHFLSAEIVGVGVPLGPLPDRCRRSPLYSSPKPSPLNSELNLRVPSIFTRISLLFRYVGRSTRLKQVCAFKNDCMRVFSVGTATDEDEEEEEDEEKGDVSNAADGMDDWDDEDLDASFDGYEVHPGDWSPDDDESDDDDSLPSLSNILPRPPGASYSEATAPRR